VEKSEREKKQNRRENCERRFVGLRTGSDGNVGEIACFGENLKGHRCGGVNIIARTIATIVRKPNTENNRKKKPPVSTARRREKEAGDTEQRNDNNREKNTQEKKC
jgi:hypothetical protein